MGTELKNAQTWAAHPVAHRTISTKPMLDIYAKQNQTAHLIQLNFVLHAKKMGQISE